MFSVQHTSDSKDQPAAGHAFFFPFISKYYAEGGLGLTNFIHNFFSSQPSKSTNSLSKRASVNNFDTITIDNNNSTENIKLISRFHHSTTVFNSAVYMIGGQSFFDNSSDSNNNLSLSKNLVVFDFSLLNISEQDSNLSVTGHGAVPFLNGSEVLILFGKEELNSKIELSNPGVKLVDVKTGNVTIPNNIKGQTPELRYHHSTTLINNKVYIIGGLDKNDNILSDIVYLDLSSSTWVLPNIQQQQQFPIAGHSSIAIDRYLISCFGFNKEKLFNDCNVYDTSNNSYLSTKINGTPPSPRSYSSMTLTPDSNNNSTVIIFGGLDGSNQGNNELYSLDTSKLPDLLSWTPIIVSYKLNIDKSLIPSPRGGHSAFTINDKINNNSLMIIWGGISGNNSVDSGIYFFDVKSNSWIDNVAAGYPEINVEFATPDENTGSESSNTSLIIIVVGTVCGVFIIFAIIGFLLILKRKKLKDDKEIQNDPYIRPGGKLGSNMDLSHEEAECKSVQNSNNKNDNDGFTKTNKSSHYQQQQHNQHQEDPTPPLSPSITDDENDTEPIENRELSSINSNISDVSNTKDIPSLPTMPEPVTSKESIPQKIKRSHKRSSSVSLTAYDIENISQTKQFTFPKPSLSIGNISNHHHQHNNNYTIKNRYSNNESIMNQFQWTMNNKSINKQEVKDKRNSSLRDYSYNDSKPQDDEYTIHGDYIDTTSTKISYNNNNDEISNNSIKKSKRSSNRRSRVSFALTDEKIEYNESDSSKTVSLVRMSRSSYQSSSSSNSHSSLSSISNTPSIIEEEEEEIKNIDDNEKNDNDNKLFI